jgi:hypothetical protein
MRQQVAGGAVAPRQSGDIADTGEAHLPERRIDLRDGNGRAAGGAQCPAYFMHELDWRSRLGLLKSPYRRFGGVGGEPAVA